MTRFGNPVLVIGRFSSHVQHYQVREPGVDIQRLPVQPRHGLSRAKDQVDLCEVETRLSGHHHNLRWLHHQDQ
ncbi:hypothetical protein EVAR_17940_1 [Eumeta japonica]|uniref:Uncharacterized protein n=1 Tax=Eumeta variegata TaxID=151549 RepID=A0A4C1UY81_EUMVA|nr:hypothetical protein EVAR_17940_1 [Eumeta japonica]